MDTLNDDNEVALFLNIFNEFHAKQTSKKTRAVFESKLKNGMNCHSILPYGDGKDAKHRGRICRPRAAYSRLCPAILCSQSPERL